MGQFGIVIANVSAICRTKKGGGKVHFYQIFLVKKINKMKYKKLKIEKTGETFRIPMEDWIDIRRSSILILSMMNRLGVQTDLTLTKQHGVSKLK